MSLFDENAEVLRELASRGSELGTPRLVDFSHVFPDLSSAQGFAEESGRKGFKVKVEEIDHAAHLWDVTASKIMMPTCENITQAEEQLAALAQRYGGSSDGWGFFRT